jgi:transcriptional regulator of heat shock response
MISDRQIRLLNAIINEYINTSEPVGSVEVVKKYNLKYSPATARNEMSELKELGFLEMVHTSSGRVPTAMAYRLFLDQIMEESEMPVLQEVSMKQRLWPSRFEFDRLLRQAVLSLSENVKELIIGTANEGHVTCAGMVNILDHKEFWDIDVARTALNLLDRYELLEEIFNKSPYGEEVRTVIGTEIGIEKLENCAFVFSSYQAGNKSGYISVFGPARLKYDNVIPAVRYTKNLIEELGESW